MSASALEDWEIPLFWGACDQIGWPFGPLFQLLLILGPRRDELACAPWTEFDLDRQVWTLPASRAKNGQALITHLPRLACDTIGGLPAIANPNGDVFCTGRRGSKDPISGFGHAGDRLEAEMRKLAAAQGIHEIKHFHRHDLRRSQATGMAALEIAPHVIDKIQNHVTGKISGVARIYNRYEYLPERKAALDRWASHIERLIGRASA